MALVWLFVAETTRTVAQPAELEDEVGKTAKDAIASGNVVGVSIGIALGDDVLLAEGYGFADLESKVPASAQTVYRIGSITKQFTAAAILQLAEKEKVALDDPITKYLPEYPTGDHLVTIRHLLQHTSGIQSFTDLPSYRSLMRHDVSHDEIIGRFKDLPFHFEPGERFRYCNSGYYLLGVILESAAETPYEKYLQDNAFNPLCLKQTSYDRTRRVTSHRAKGYRRGRDGIENAPYLSMTQPFSAGALASTVTDLIRWQRGLVSKKLLDDESYQTMTTRGVRSNGEQIDYGMGLFIRKSGGRRTIGHGGGINGFRSDLTYYPESDHTIVVLTNCESAKPGRISKQIARHLFAKPAPNQSP
jgi:CubicO group peptidase (beta-lactamase class C family)